MSADKNQNFPASSLSEQLLLAYIQEDREWKRSIERRLGNVESSRPIAITPQTMWLILIIVGLLIALVVFGLGYVRSSGSGGGITLLLQGIEMMRQYSQEK